MHQEGIISAVFLGFPIDGRRGLTQGMGKQSVNQGFGSVVCTSRGGQRQEKPTCHHLPPPPPSMDRGAGSRHPGKRQGLGRVRRERAQRVRQRAARAHMFRAAAGEPPHPPLRPRSARCNQRGCAARRGSGGALRNHTVRGTRQEPPRRPSRRAPPPHARGAFVRESGEPCSTWGGRFG